jgi:uroporphyrinogen III methyltransferase/synthase
MLIRRARQGKTVVRLKGGDPFIFGRGGEEALALHRAGIPFEIVPGVSAALAVPAYAGIPMTHRSVASSFAVVSGHAYSRGGVDWGAVARSVDTVVILMGLHNLARIMSELVAGGCEPQRPVALIESGTKKQQRVLIGTVATIGSLAADAEIHSPALIVIGEAVRLRAQLAWFDADLRGLGVVPDLASGEAAIQT